MCVDNTSSKILDITSGLPQGLLVGPILFCIFIKDLPNVQMFSEPFIFADDRFQITMIRSFSNLELAYLAYIYSFIIIKPFYYCFIDKFE